MIFMCKTFLLISCRDLIAQIRDERTAEAHGPAAISTREENSLQRMPGSTAFSGPMLTAVAGMNDCSFSAYRPTFLRIYKLHVKQIDIDG
jgi:hypothetical protein